MELNLKAIQECMERQIARPAQAQCNSESAFVKDTLNKQGLNSEAKAYWNWACIKNSQSWVTPEITELQKQLDKIDSQSTMPSWGTYGT